MAFCKYCGTQIQDGELCNCEKAVASRTVVETPAPAPAPVAEPAPAVAPAQEAAPQQAAPVGTNIDYNDIMNKGKNIANGLWGQFLAIWKKPADGSATFVKTGNQMDAIIFMVIQAILSGVLMLVLISKIESAIQGAVNGLSSMMGGQTTAIQLPYAEGFFTVFIASIVISAVYLVTMFAVLRIVKANESFKEATCFAGLRSIVAIPFTLVGIVMSFLNPLVGVVINMVPLGLGLVYLAQGMNGFESVEKNKRTHLLAVVNVVAIALVVFIGSSVLKEAINDLVSQLSNYFGYLF